MFACSLWILGAFVLGGTLGIVVMAMMVVAGQGPSIPPASLSPLDTATEPL